LNEATLLSCPGCRAAAKQPCLISSAALTAPTSSEHQAKGTKAVLLFTLLSAILFTLWHPLNALTINSGAQAFFYDPYFLAIVFFLGIVCSLTYILSRSLWVPIIIHWLTVVVWVIFLGGRNLLLK
jgi:predicted Abi (CAAX) family protease